MLRNCCRSSGPILPAPLLVAGAAPAQIRVENQVPQKDLMPDDAAARAHVSRQVIRRDEELPAQQAELEERIAAFSSELGAQNEQRISPSARMHVRKAALALAEPAAAAVPAVTPADARAALAFERSADTGVVAWHEPSRVSVTIATAPVLPEQPETQALPRDLLIEAHHTIEALRPVQSLINRQSCRSP